MGEGNHKKRVFEHPYRWSGSSICNILKKREYLGHTINFKSTKSSYKDKRNQYVDASEWVVFENTHEPIIDQNTFDNAQRIRANAKRCPDEWGEAHPLTGLVWCSDCGGKLYCHRTHNGKYNPHYVCVNATKADEGGLHCTVHRISADVLMKLITETLKEIVRYAMKDKSAFEKSIRDALSTRQTNEVKAQRKQLAKLKKRQSEIETLFRRIYEDSALGKLPMNRFEAMAAEYEQEREIIERDVPLLEAAINRFESDTDRAAKFAELVKRYSDFEELTPTIINEFIEKIVVHERERRYCADTEQNVEIHLNFVGEYKAPSKPIDPATLAAQEEEKRRKTEWQEKRHLKYLRLKEAGKIAEYERNTEARRAAGIPLQRRYTTPEEKAYYTEYLKAYRKEYHRQYHLKNKDKYNAERREKRAAEKAAALAKKPSA
jgi:hypothetical protein